MNSVRALSANTLFHFTNTPDKLENILRKDFQPKYCLENYEFFISGWSELAIPLVSFCDIPLSQTRNHVKYYGHYAIGLSKEWGMKNHISPVLYMHEQARSSDQLREIFIETIKNPSNKENTEFSELTQNFIKFLKFLKPYQGKLWRDGEYKEDIITFYDEREWRFCPDIPFLKNDENDKPRCFLSKNEFTLENGRKLITGGTFEDENIKLEKYKLCFEPRDVKYIIVNKENEILEMIRKLQDIKRKYSYEDIQILTTRIISMEHIFEDF